MANSSEFDRERDVRLAVNRQQYKEEMDRKSALADKRLNPSYIHLNLESKIPGTPFLNFKDKY